MADFAIADVLAEIDKQAGGFGIHPSVAKALAFAENTADGSPKGKSFSGDAVSSKSARGIMQVIPSTARGLQQAGLLPSDWKHDPDNLSSQVAAGLAAMKDMKQRLKNPDDPFELASYYNGGSSGVKAYQSGDFTKLAPETSQYLPKVKKALMELGFATPPSQNVMTPPSPLLTNQGAQKVGSTSTSTRTSVSDPVSMEMFTNQAFGMAAPGGSIDQTLDSVMNSAIARDSAVQQLQIAIASKGVAAAAEAGTVAMAEATAAARRAAILTSMNLNPDLSGNMANRAVDTINSTDVELNSLKPEIDRRMAVGFFDNPIEWLINQVRLPGMVEQYNGIATTQNAAISSYKNVASIASTQQSLSASMDADLLLRKGVDVKAKIAADTAADLAKVQAEAAGATTRDALVIAQITSSKLGVMKDLVGATKTTTTETESAREKMNAQQALQFDLDKANALIKAAGGSGFSMPAFAKLDAKERGEILTRASKGVFGDSFGDSFAFQETIGNRRNMAVQGGAASITWMDATLKTANQSTKVKIANQEKTTGKQMTLKQKEETIPAELNAVQALYENQQSSDMRTASDGNPYKLEYSIIAKDSKLANNPLAIFINQFGPGGKEETFATIDERYLLDRFSASVAKGTMNVVDASKAITDFYKVGVLQQAKLTAYPLYGLKPASGYKVVIPQTGLFSRGSVIADTVDLTNSTKVENYLTRSVALKAAEAQAAKGMFGAPPLDPLGIAR